MNLTLQFKNNPALSGSIIMEVEQKRNGETIDGFVNLMAEIAVQPQSMDITVGITGSNSQSNNAASSESKIVIKAVNGAVPLLDVKLDSKAKAQVDKNVQIAVPVLTPANSIDFNELNVAESQPEPEAKITGFPGLEQQVDVVIDGRYINFDVKPFIKDKRTMVPIRNLTEALGCKVTFVGDREVHISKDNSYIIMTIGEKKYSVNGLVKDIDVPAYVKDGRTIVPLRFIAEEFGCQLKLVDDTVIITTK
ncbi:hypothetical protein N752_13530 [Desulforamulus aquiferis]|nr:copper amine oxidase N-terminal domain-containing protein [Desulforamulus aquiferis]RYD04390.1 hypothetical protein N752_13530 [Desulforamulus aquiferis]